MVLGILVGPGSSLSDFGRHGQLERLVDYYFPAYLERFERLRFFSYEPERLGNFTSDRELRRRVEIFAPTAMPRRRIYAVRLGLGRSRALLRSCAVVRALHAPGAIPAALAGTVYACTYGYPYAAETNVRAPVPVAARALEAKRTLVRAGLRFVLTRAAATIVTSASTEAEARRLGASTIWRIANGVDLELFAPSDDDPVYDVVYVGALTPGKDVATLLRAVSLLDTRPRVAIVGDGPERRTLEEIAATRGVDAMFLGVLRNSAAADVLRRARCYVLPSLSEGQPKALLEAMATGLACIATDIDAVRDVAPRGEALLFPPRDAAALAERLREVLTRSDRAAQLGRRARQRVEQQFDLARLLRKETELLASLAVDARRRAAERARARTAS